MSRLKIQFDCALRYFGETHDEDVHEHHNQVMAEWKKRAKKSNDVIYFPYASDNEVAKAPEVYLWDVDKTYLDTKFESIRGLLKTATEKANQKRNIPGTGELVRALERAWNIRNKENLFPIFFVTASPPQMERKIREKLKLDRVNPIGIFCKDNLPNLRPRRFWRLNKQVGYKLQALLQLRSLLKEDVRVILFGDDGESDAIIYSLFSDICSRRLDTSELRRILNALFVLDEQVDTLFRLQDSIPTNDPVEKIYINLIDDTDADYYLKFGRRILPTSSSLQAALDLYQDQRLFPEQVVDVAKTLINQYRFTVEEIELQVDDLVRRNRLARETFEKIVPALVAAKCVRPEFRPSIAPKPVQTTLGQTVVALEGNFEVWVPERIDYLHDYR